MSDRESTVCPFCNLGCRLSFEVKDGEVRRVEYTANSRNEGRLCPRGNAASSFVNHPKRLYHSIVEGKSSSIAAGIEYLRRRLSDYKPEEVLFLYDNTFSVEEIDAYSNWISASGFKNMAYVSFSPAKVFNYGKRNSVNQDAVTSAGYALIVGDPYSQFSVVSGYLAKAKSDNKDFRYIAVDSVASNTSHFAHKFIRVKPGFEGLFMFGLWKVLTGKDKESAPLAEALGLETGAFESTAGMIRNREGILINSPVYARSFDPFLTHAVCLRLARDIDGITYLPLGIRTPGRVAKPFSSFLPMIMGGRVKAIISFAPTFPWGLMHLRSVLKKADFVSLSSFFIPEGRFEFDLLLPMASELEKKGTIQTVFGEEKLNLVIPPISGTLSVGHYLERISGSPLASKGSLPDYYEDFADSDIEIRAKALLDMASEKPKKGYKHLLVASEPAIGFMSVFENEDWIKINPRDAQIIEASQGDEVGVETEQTDIALKLVISEEIPQGAALVSANHGPSLALFELSTDSSTCEGLLKPTWSRLWKK